MSDYTDKIFSFFSKKHNTLRSRKELLDYALSKKEYFDDFLRYEVSGGALAKTRKGALIATAQGKSSTYGIHLIQDKGPIFLSPADEVYEGMLIGINGREEDLEVNVCKEKALSNCRSIGDASLDYFRVPKTMELEDALEYIGDDELVEVTPKNVRIRKVCVSPRCSCKICIS